jgi:pyrroline-5-carboxylate reductase
VVSPGGTTAAGLLELESAGVPHAIMRAVEAAYAKALELGK